MEWVETTGSTNESAIQEALEALGIELRDAEVVIVSPAKKGIFGIASKQARVRVRVKPQFLPRKKQFKKRSSYNNRDERKSYSNPAVQSDNTTPGNQQRTSDRIQKNFDKTTGQPSEATRRDKNNQFDRPRKYRNNQTGSMQTEGNETSLVKDKIPAVATQQSRKYKTGDKPLPEISNTLQKEVDEMEIEEKAKIAVHFLQELLTQFGFSAKVEASIDNPQILINIDGPELGILVGPKGFTLDAIQDITRTIIQRNENTDERTRLTVDVSHYREKRAKALMAFVQKLGQEVIETGVTKKLEPMSSPDRKIVHDTVSAMEGLETRSEGFEPRRRVVIYKSSENSEAEVLSK